MMLTFNNAYFGITKYLTFHRIEQHLRQHLAHICVSQQTVPQVYKQRPEVANNEGRELQHELYGSAKP
jgi:hypothetical protein